MKTVPFTALRAWSVLNYAVGSFLEKGHFESLLAIAGWFKRRFQSSGDTPIPRSPGMVNRVVSQVVDRVWVKPVVFSSHPFAIGKQGIPRCTLSRARTDYRLEGGFPLWVRVILAFLPPYPQLGRPSSSLEQVRLSTLRTSPEQFETLAMNVVSFPTIPKFPPVSISAFTAHQRNIDYFWRLFAVLFVSFRVHPISLL